MLRKMVLLFNRYQNFTLSTIWGGVLAIIHLFHLWIFMNFQFWMRSLKSGAYYVPTVACVLERTT